MARGRPSVAAGLAAVCAVAQGCTDGTTPDCSDAQCVVLSVVEAGADGVVDGAQGDAGNSGEDATKVGVSDDADTGPTSDGGPDAG